MLGNVTKTYSLKKSYVDEEYFCKGILTTSDFSIFLCIIQFRVESRGVYYIATTLLHQKSVEGYKLTG